MLMFVNIASESKTVLFYMHLVSDVDKLVIIDVLLRVNTFLDDGS